MSEISINGSALGNSLMTLLTANSIEPGDEPSYILCKTIYTHHPLGAKMVDKPTELAQSHDRIITVGNDVGNQIAAAFEKEWKALKSNETIAALARWARVYGVASIGALDGEMKTGEPLDFKSLSLKELTFNVWDPLNTAGSIVLNQNPNAADYQKPDDLVVMGTKYHQSRTVTLFNESPVYIGYSKSAFGYVGRSVYQRPLFPLKSFIQSMVTNDMVSLKAGVLVVKVKQTGGIIDNLMANVAGQKRGIVQEAQNGNVISISTEEEIETLNMQNVDGAFMAARKNILDDIATGGGMPAKLLNSETFAEGFGEGTEDARAIAQYIGKYREWLEPAYEYMTKIVMYRAWNKAFYKTIQNQFPDEYANKSFTTAFYEWMNSFNAGWPSLLEESDKERAEGDELKAKSVMSVIENLGPLLDPENKTRLLIWATENINGLTNLFSQTIEFDPDELRNYVPPAIVEDQEESNVTRLPKPRAA